MSLPIFDAVLSHCKIASMNAEMSDYGMIDNAAIAWRDGKIVYAGAEADLPEHQHPHELYDLKGALVTPGFIDCHTHLVFGGDRADEFERRLSGVSYEEIARAGGGIMSSVRRTRAASLDELIEQSMPRARDLIAEGVSTIEIKSGYGLEFNAEHKMLQAARAIGRQCGITVRTSLLAAHALPPEYRERRSEYLRLINTLWMPQLASEGLIDAVDAYCEKIAFSAEEVRVLFETARQLNLPVKLHADQLSDQNGAALVAEFHGLSADHLEFTSSSGIAAMSKQNTVAVLIPAAYYFLRETQLPPITTMRELGVAMAVASDVNPGTSPIRSLRTAMNMACVLFQLTPLEALLGVTRHAAAALGLASSKGQIREGFDADLAIWKIDSPAALSYWLDGNLCRATIAQGKIVAGQM